MSKYLILALAFAMAYSAISFGTVTHAGTAASHGSTKLNGTCNVTQTYALPFTGGAASGSLYHTSYWATTTTQATTSASDWLIFCAWAVTETSTSAVSATFATSPACSVYISSGTAYALSTSLTTSSSVTTANTATIMSSVPYALHNTTTSNFTKNSLTLYQVSYYQEAGTALAYTSTWGTGSASNLDVTACNTALKAFTSFSIQASSVIATLFSFSFF